MSLKKLRGWFKKKILAVDFNLKFYLYSTMLKKRINDLVLIGIDRDHHLKIYIIYIYIYIWRLDRQIASKLIEWRLFWSVAKRDFVVID
jgi:hypothetical protein